MTIHVLLLDQYGEIGGAQRGLIEAAQGFAARGWSLHAAIPTGPLHGKLAPLCASLTALPCGPFRAVRKSPLDAVHFLPQLREQAAIVEDLVRRHTIDILYVNGPRVLPAAAMARAGRPLVYHAHSVVTQPTAAALVRTALRASRAHILASSTFAGHWLSPLPRQVIYNGIAGWNGEPRPRRHHTRIGVLGRIAPEKQQLLFVEAAHIAAGSNPELRFLIGGGPVLGSQAYFDRVRAAAGPETEFIPWMDDVRSFFDRIDVLVVPSDRSDANPRVIPEAFAAGVPVVAFDSGGIPELIEHGRTGLLVREHTAPALAAAILEAIAQPAFLHAIAERAHAEWRERFTLPRYQSEVSRALESLVPSRAKATA